MSSLITTWDSEVFLFQADSREELVRRGEALRPLMADGRSMTCRDLAYTLDCASARDTRLCLAIVAGSFADLNQKLEHALKRLADPETHRIKERNGIYFFDQPLGLSGDLAFLFPGEGAQYRNMLADLCVHFTEVREWFDLIDQAFVGHPRQLLPSQVIFGPAPEVGDDARLWQMDCGTEAIFAANQALFTLLTSLGIRPRVVLGHSTGEYSALLAAGAVHLDDRDRLIPLLRRLNDVYEQVRERGQISEGELCAVSAPERETVLNLVEQSGGRLFVAMDNCPHQIVLYAAVDEMDKAKTQLAAAGCMCASLPFNRAYHTPLFAPFAEAVAGFVQELNLSEPAIEIYSGTTAEPYPKAPGEMRRLAAEMWMRPVRFRETVEAIYAAGVRLFVEVGPRGNLTAFVDDILRGRPYSAIPANVMSRSGIEQLNHLVAQLAAHCVPMKLDALFALRSPRQVELNGTHPPVVKEADHPVRVLASLPILDLGPAWQAKVAEPSGTSVAVVPAPPAVTRPSRAAVMHGYMETMQKFLKLNECIVQAVIDRGRPAAPNVLLGGAALKLPFIERIISRSPGRSLTATCVLNLDEHLFLRDHVLGGPVSAWDREITALPVVPLTISVEMLAEAAAALVPDKQVVGLKDVRAHRWLALPDGSLPLRLTATARESWREVAVQISIDGPEVAPAIQPGALAVEGKVLLADAEMAAEVGSELALGPLEPSTWSPQDLYSKGMFHGPQFQGVASIDRCGAGGVEATLRVLPAGDLLLSDSNPRFLTHPVLLDGAGQVIGHWAIERCERGFNVFPFHIEAVELHKNELRAGELASCRARISLTESVVRSDIEVTAMSGTRVARLVGWEDRRFDLPESLVNLRIAPRDHLVGGAWPAPIETLPAAQAFTCSRIDDLPMELLRGHGRVWEQVLAHLVLSRRERKVWRDLATAADRRRNHWLLGRCAAKDAVRMLLKERHGLQLYAADVEIEADEHGRPEVGGFWSERLDSVPLISISHIDGLAVAIASDGPHSGIGIDVERVRDLGDALLDVAFTAAERELLRGLGEAATEEWTVRFWCAKEAALKAVGRGMADGPKGAVITSVDQPTGTLEVTLSTELKAQLPRHGLQLITRTAREGDLALATCVCEQS